MIVRVNQTNTDKASYTVLEIKPLVLSVANSLKWYIKVLKPVHGI